MGVSWRNRSLSLSKGQSNCVRAFSCRKCGDELFFENSVCLSCGSAVGYSRQALSMVVVDDQQPICANLDRCGCNWIADPGSPIGLCFNCSLTRTRPADGDTLGMTQYWVAEAAIRRLVFGLDELGLPVKISDGYRGLAFDLLSSHQNTIITGYHNGVITLDLAESDDAHREALRQSMDEPYRTVPVTSAMRSATTAGSWLPLTKGLNQINRSMGRGDLYPFVLGQPVISKLAFVADLVAR